MENRRRTDRVPAGWAGSCKLAGEPASGWRECRIVDISKLGLGITFDYSDPSELSGRQISLNLPGDASSINIRLEGEIKNAAPMSGGAVRVGIQFARLSETEQAVSAVLSGINDMLVKT